MITADVKEVLDKSYDFVVVGGGTAGLTLAARLSENPSVTVAVIEAGENTIGEPLISIPASFGQPLGNPRYDWAFMTTKQKYSNDKELLWSRGKGLGGSSCINFLVWILPPSIDIDAFEKLGNPGWNWDDFYQYARKVENFHPPGKEVTDLFPHTYGDDRGTSGHVQTTIPPSVHTLDTLMREAFVNSGIDVLEDPYRGQVNGTWITSSTIDPRTWTRSNSAKAYLVPAQDRPNLTILTRALVSRVLFVENTAGSDLVATGVEFIHGGNKYVVNAQKEVILSAGAIKDPQILELSGIGNLDILSKIGVEAKVELPGVGENLQDHNFSGVSYELNPSGNHETLDSLLKPENAQAAAQLYAEGKGPLRNGLTSLAYFPSANSKIPGAEKLVQAIEQDIEDWKNSPGIAPGLREQLDVQLEALRSKESPEFEIVVIPMLFSATVKPDPEKAYLTLFNIIVHPLSRGTIHAKSNDPQDYPEVDPRYFERDSDLEILVQGIKYIRALADAEPLKSAYVGNELQPGPECQTDEELREYIKNTHNTAWHGLGTCSMLPRDKQGVVDSHLKVYGTKNLRIADISIIPLQIAAHTQCEYPHSFMLLNADHLCSHGLRHRGEREIQTFEDAVFVQSNVDMAKDGDVFDIV
ncbi:hypothetical protein H0H92_009041 [Tricholoma furcatifolium]|nr:hypothetical protein H0H92_009041 [Tricholoma furcatifolium]